jgi:hypothetical protein
MRRIDYHFFVTEEISSKFQHKLCAVRETTREERDEWIKERVKNNQSLINCSGESILAPHIVWVNLKGCRIQTDRTSIKVPFVDGSFRPWTGYGSIFVSKEAGGELQKMYLPSNEIKRLKKVLEELHEKPAIFK